jgi:hypothetical protein
VHEYDTPQLRQCDACREASQRLAPLAASFPNKPAVKKSVRANRAALAAASEEGQLRRAGRRQAEQSVRGSGDSERQLRAAAEAVMLGYRGFDSEAKGRRLGVKVKLFQDVTSEFKGALNAGAFAGPLLGAINVKHPTRIGNHHPKSAEARAIRRLESQQAEVQAASG